MQPYVLLWKLLDVYEKQWVATMYEGWVYSRDPSLSLLHYITNEYKITAVYDTEHRCFAIYFDSEADATAFILKLS